MTEAIQTLTEGLQKNIHEVREEFKRANDVRTRESAEWKEKYAKMEADIVAQGKSLEGAIKEAEAQKKRADAIEVAFKQLQTSHVAQGYTPDEIKAANIWCDKHRRRGRTIEAGKEIETLKLYEKAFDSWLRTTKIADMPEAEQKAMYTFSAADGGIFVLPPMIEAGIDKGVIRQVAMRQLCPATTIGGQQLKWKYRVSKATAQRGTEGTPTTASTTPKYGDRTISIHRMEASYYITHEMMNDTDYDYQGEFTSEAAEQFADMEDYDFILGSGVGRARGILTYADGSTYGTITRVLTGATTGMLYTATGAAKGLLGITKALKPQYQAGAKWLMAWESWFPLLEITDGNSRYVALISPASLNADLPTFTFFGKQVVFSDNMPAVTSASLSYVYGDFRSAYRIVQKAGRSAIKTVEQYFPDSEIKMTQSVGGDVVDYRSLIIGVCTA